MVGGPDEEMGMSTANQDWDEIETDTILSDPDEKSRRQPQQLCSRFINSLDQTDKDWSDVVQRNNNKYIEAVLCVPAHMFNRSIILAPMALSVILGACRYDVMLTHNGF